MLSHLDIGPIYCETPQVVAAFPIEPVNTLTSLIPAVLGLVALYILIREKNRSVVLYVLSILLFLTGTGSVLWHGLRTPLSLSFDVFPGLLFFLVFTFVWPLFLRGRWLAYGVFGGLLLGQILLPRLVVVHGVMGHFYTLFGLTALAALLLTILTFRYASHARWWALAVFVTALTAAAARILDGMLCGVLPAGSHFLWHIFLGSAGFCCVLLLRALHARSNN